MLVHDIQRVQRAEPIVPVKPYSFADDWILSIFTVLAEEGNKAEAWELRDSAFRGEANLPDRTSKISNKKIQRLSQARLKFTKTFVPAQHRERAVRV